MQITIEDELKRINAVERLKKAREKGLKSGFYNDYPCYLEEINRKIEALKAWQFEFTDTTQELVVAIAYFGGCIRDCNFGSDRKKIKYKDSMTLKQAVEAVEEFFS